MCEYEPHEFADIFPLLGVDDLQALASDIKANGLNNPIWLFGGKVLDGRNRLAACEIAGIEPTFKEFGGTAIEALELVRSENIHRRHLTPSQGSACYLDWETRHGDLVARQKEAAKERQREGNSKGGKKSGETRRGETKSTQQIESTSADRNGGGMFDSFMDRNISTVKTVRIVRYGIGKQWCLWWLFDTADPLIEQGYVVTEARAERCKILGRHSRWWPFWKCWLVASLPAGIAQFRRR